MKNKKILTLLFLVSVRATMLQAQSPEKTPGEKESPKAIEKPAATGENLGVDVGFSIVTNYVFRGDDVFTAAAMQRGESYGGSTGAPAFQPSVTFALPVQGLSFNIWGSFAMSNRQDQDIDGVLQQGPGGDDLLAPSNGADIPGAIIGALPVATDVDTLAALDLKSCAATTGCIPGYYKEENGLKRLDEIDLTLSFDKETKNGNFGTGLIHYTHPGTIGKDGYGAITEAYFKYAFPFFTDLTFAVYSAVSGARYEYYNVSYSRDLELTKDLALSLGVGAGYQVQDSMQGWKDVTAGVHLNSGGFTIGFNVAYRPDLRFQESLIDGDPNTELPLWLYGGSTIGDGLVADPARTNGLINTAVNSVIGGTIQAPGTTFSYTPRTKLPRAVYWFDVGYTMSI